VNGRRRRIDGGASAGDLRAMVVGGARVAGARAGCGRGTPEGVELQEEPPSEGHLRKDRRRVIAGRSRAETSGLGREAHLGRGLCAQAAPCAEGALREQLLPRETRSRSGHTLKEVGAHVRSDTMTDPRARSVEEND
jgi:hypothetical protein